jgi:hypothetical protein
MKEHLLISYLDFLAAFYPNEREPICFRAFKPKGAMDNETNRPQKLQLRRAELATGLGERTLRELNATRGIFFAPNGGGHTNAEIRQFNAVFVERDDIPIAEQHELLDQSPISTSIRVETKRSVHAYWLLKPGSDLVDWKDAQIRLIEYFEADQANKNPSRLMRLPGFDHLTHKADGALETTLVEIVQFDPNKRYSIGEILEVFEKSDCATLPSAAGQYRPSQTIIGNGQRNTTLFSIAGSMRRAGLDEKEILRAIEGINEKRVIPPLDSNELRSLASNVMRYSSAAEQARIREGVTPDPPFLSPAALYGPAGELINTIGPHTEADLPALLVQLLSGFGCMIGRSAHFIAEADPHFTKINAVLVGESSKSRKGTSWGHVRRLLLWIDGTFEHCILDGLSSGEGMTYQVRDPRYKKSPIKNGKRIVGYQDELEDEGAAEKRLFVLEPEFSRVLRVMQREGNTLSPLIRQAWDSDRLNVMTKSPLQATGAHITIVGHITLAELQRNLSDTDMLNGFANRFLWVFTKRSKELPFGGSLAEDELRRFVPVLRTALDFAQTVGELKRSPEANELWAAEYGRLSGGSPDLVGAVTSRAEAQVMRIALIYAVLDSSRMIDRRHLEAALALWQYAEDSASYIFGDRTGDRVANRIYSALRATPEGMTRSDFQQMFQRNVKSDRISSALDRLTDAGLIRSQPLKTGGRNAYLYVATCHVSP